MKAFLTIVEEARATEKRGGFAYYIFDPEIEARQAEISRLVREVADLAWLKGHEHNWGQRKDEDFQYCVNCGAKK